MSATDATPSELWSRWRVRLGYPVALVSFALAHPSRRSIAWGAGIAALGLLLRGAAAGYLRKGEGLTTAGPYAHTRNPLYLGSALLASGFLVASASWIAAALVGAYFIVFYPIVMRREEQELRRVYSAAFEGYAARVPRFWPRAMPARSANDAAAPTFSWSQYRRNREYEAALGYGVAIAMLWFRMYWRW